MSEKIKESLKGWVGIATHLVVAISFFMKLHFTQASLKEDSDRQTDRLNNIEEKLDEISAFKVTIAVIDEKLKRVASLESRVREIEISVKSLQK